MAVLDSLPDRRLTESELRLLEDGDAIDFAEALVTSVEQHADVVDACLLEANGTGHVLVFADGGGGDGDGSESDEGGDGGWSRRGSFDAAELDLEAKIARATELLRG